MIQKTGNAPRLAQIQFNMTGSHETDGPLCQHGRILRKGQRMCHATQCSMCYDFHHRGDVNCATYYSEIRRMVKGL